MMVDAFTKFVYFSHTIKLDTDSCFKAVRSLVSLYGVSSRLVDDQDCSLETFALLKK